jgi:hypothetical protein
VMDKCSKDLPDSSTICLAPSAGAPTSEANHASDDHGECRRDPDPSAGRKRRPPASTPATADVRFPSSSPAFV